MGCGAETPPRAARCPVCGRESSLGGGAPVAPRDIPLHSTATATRPGALPPASVDVATARPSTPDEPLVISTARGGVSAPMLPKDALGVTLLVVCAALALDILAPWSASYTVRQSLVSRFGHPAYVVVALALIAALPLYHPRFRQVPLYTAAPLVVGALVVGIGLTYYVFLARENAQALSQTTFSSPLLASQSRVSTPISPQLGLYLFMLIGVVLVVVGYQLFLAAVRAQYIVVALPQLPAQPLVSAPSAVLAATAFGAPNGVPSPSSVPLSAVSTPAQAAMGSTPPPERISAASPAPSSAPPAPIPTPAAARSGTADHDDLVLPGTDAWNQPPVSPVFTKQTRMRGGWRYSSR